MFVCLFFSEQLYACDRVCHGELQLLLFWFLFWGYLFCLFLGLTVHGQVRRRLHLTGRVGGATRVDARILWVGGFDQKDCVITFLDHLLHNRQTTKKTTRTKQLKTNSKTNTRNQIPIKKKTSVIDNRTKLKFLIPESRSMVG